jgi:catechol 2,3-dioxygenase-like lactoylglutathione lyase family enzyme
MLKIQDLRTFAIGGRDITASEKFYTEVLGASVTRRIAPNPEQRRGGVVLYAQCGRGCVTQAESVGGIASRDH